MSNADLEKRVRDLEAFLEAIVEDGKYQHWEFNRRFVVEAQRLLDEKTS